MLKILWEDFLRGEGLRKGWEYFWRMIDNWIGIFCRWILKINTKTVPNKVMFLTQELKYCCNPKYISEELIQSGYDDLKVVWRAPVNGRGDIPDCFKAVEFNSPDYFRELYSSHIIIANSFIFRRVPVRLKKDQILIQTWHGSLGLKKHNKETVKSHSLKKGLIKTAKMTDYCITNSQLEYDSFRTAYWPKTPLLKYGHARNDLFFDVNKERRDAIRDKIFKEYGIDKDTRVVMYAPTFRDNSGFSTYSVDYVRLVEVLEKKFGGKWCVLLRFHPALIKDYKKMNPEQNFGNAKVIDVTEYPDMQELICATDVALTDYSSWIYDFILLRKPGFIFATDIKEYQAKERGFFYPIETVPFPIAENNDELVDAIASFDEEKYLNDVEAFLDDKGCVDDGLASKRIVELIRKLIKGEIIDDVITD